MDQTASVPVPQQPQPAVPFSFMTASSAATRLSAFGGTSPNSFSDTSFPAPRSNPFRSGPILSPVFNFNTPSPTSTTQLPHESGSFRFQFSGSSSSSSAAPTFAFPPSTASAPARANVSTTLNAFESPPAAQPPSTSLPVPVAPTTVPPPPSTPQFGSGLNFPTPILTANSSSARLGGAPHPPAGPAQGAGGPSGGQPAAQPAGEAPGPAFGPPGAGTLPRRSLSLAALRRAAGLPGPAEPAGAGTPSLRRHILARSVPTGSGTPEVFSFTPPGSEAGEPGPSVRPGPALAGGTARATLAKKRRNRVPKPNSVGSTETKLPEKATPFVVESTEGFPLDEIFMTELGFVQSRTGRWTIGHEGEGAVSADTNLETPKGMIGEKTKLDAQKDGEDDAGKLLVVYEKEPPEFCLCTICQGLLKDPVQLPLCPHVMCKTCIESWRIMSATCPTCRKVIPRGLDLVPNLFAAKAIEDLRVRCPYGVILAERNTTVTSTDTKTTPPKSPVAKISPLESDAAASGIFEPFFLGKTHRLLHGGCSAVLSRLDLESHVTKCDQRTRDCPFGCGLRGPPDVLDLHRCRKSSDKILKKQIVVTKQLALDLTRKASSTCSRLRTENGRLGTEIGHLRSRLDLRNPDGSFAYNSPDPFHLALRIVNLLSKEGLEGFRTFRDPIFRKVATMWMDIRRKDYDFGTFHGMKSLLGILLDSVPERSWSLGQLGTIKLWRQEVDGIVVENSIIKSLKDI